MRNMCVVCVFRVFRSFFRLPRRLLWQNIYGRLSTGVIWFSHICSAHRALIGAVNIFFVCGKTTRLTFYLILPAQ